eukprot:c26595_g1_i4 orf=520-1851(+)
MAQGRGNLPHFGDAQTADVVLLLIPLEGAALPPIHVHSKALCRSEFFEARLSERWAVDDRRPVELTLDKCKNPETYSRCIQLMYVPDRVKHSSFAGVQDALNILEVAAELLFHDCVNACMGFLESIPWTNENENAIRSCLSSLHIQVTPDLASRLNSAQNLPDCKPVEIMKELLGELLSLVTNGAPSKARDITERVLLANVQPSASPAFAAVNEVALFKELQNNLDALKSQLRKFASFFSWSSHQLFIASSALRWLLEELFALQIGDVAIKMFSEEQDLAQLMISRIYQNPFTETLFCILVRMLQALQSGEVVIPRSIRVAFITTWLPVVAKLSNDSEEISRDDGLQLKLEEGLRAVVGTLAIADQEEIFKIWIGTCLKCRRAYPDLSTTFDSWCDKLRQAQKEKDLQRGTSDTDETPGGLAFILTESSPSVSCSKSLDASPS